MYIAAIARKIGFSEQEQLNIQTGAQEALLAVFAFSFEPGEDSTCTIACERVPEGLRVSIRDKGLPVDPDQVLANACRLDTFQAAGDAGKTTGDHEPGLDRVTQAPPAFSAICPGRFWDEVSVHNLGKEGKETVLVKHARDRSVSDFCQACELTPYAAAEEPPSDTSQPGCVVRPIKESDAVEVSRCVYRTYGYTYTFEHIYHPERVLELNRTGRMQSFVAEAEDGEIAGHCALVFHSQGARIAEMAAGAVKPQFRSRGCFSAVSSAVMQRARDIGLMGVFGQPVTNHVFSQKTSLRLGLRDVALLLAYVPASVDFKAMNGALGRRLTLLTHFAYLGEPPEIVGYPPRHHRSMIERLYKGVGASLKGHPDEGPHSRTWADDSVIKTAVSSAAGNARVEVQRYGRNIVEDVGKVLRRLCLERLDVVYLYLDLVDPLTSELTHEFEQLGFFFSGILPAAFPRGDALILQYLNNVAVDYSQIHAGSDAGEELVEYVKACDPNSG
jgi:serine/threonine-protein kinase RsbW